MRREGTLKINEDNFIKYLKKKDEKALDYIIDTYGGLIKSIVKKHLYNLEHLQDECINDILLAVWDNINNYIEEKNSFKNWLAAVAKYKCIDYKRKYLKHIESENIDDMNLDSGVNVEEELLKNELSFEIENLLNNLKPQDKELFIKHYIEEQDINSLSKEIGVKDSVIYNRLSRGRNKLKAIVTKML